MADFILSDYVYYDPSSPTGLRWKVARPGRWGIKAGDVAGCIINANTYPHWQVVISQRFYLAHRAVWELCHGAPPPADMEIDHIDGNGLNNDIENLRVVTRAINGRNLKRHGRNVSGVTGVSYAKRDNAYLACYYDLNGKRRFKHFGCSRFGPEKALQMAISWRMEKMAELNSLGAGYTERHLLE